MISTKNNETAGESKHTMTEVREYVERNINDRESYKLKSDLPEDEIVLFNESMTFHGLMCVEPEILATAIRDVLIAKGKRYFATLDRSTYLAKGMRFFIESGLGKPVGYVLVDEISFWRKDRVENCGAATVFELS